MEGLKQGVTLVVNGKIIMDKITRQSRTPQKQKQTEPRSSITGIEMEQQKKDKYMWQEEYKADDI